jgi:hypothetical protein
VSLDLSYGAARAIGMRSTQSVTVAKCHWQSPGKCGVPPDEKSVTSQNSGALIFLQLP